MKSHYRPLAGMLVFSLLAWMLGIHRYLSLENLSLHHDLLRAWVDAHWFFSLVLYAIVYLLVVALTIPVATVLTLSSGWLFGPLWGTFVTVIAATSGASILFTTTKKASRGLVNPEQQSWVAKFKAGFERSAFSYLLMLRIMPVFPFFLINITSALLQIPLKIFIVATAIGIIPGTFIYASVGSGLSELWQEPDLSWRVLMSPSLVIAFLGLGLMSLIPWWYQRHRENY